jgi:hypothetical protein
MERTEMVGLFNWRKNKVRTHYTTAHPVFGTADTASPIMPPEMREFFLNSPMLSGKWDTEAWIQVEQRRLAEELLSHREKDPSEVWQRISVFYRALVQNVFSGDPRVKEAFGFIYENVRIGIYRTTGNPEAVSELSEVKQGDHPHSVDEALSSLVRLRFLKRGTPGDYQSVYIQNIRKSVDPSLTLTQFEDEIKIRTRVEYAIDEAIEQFFGPEQAYRPFMVLFGNAMITTELLEGDGLEECLVSARKLVQAERARANEYVFVQPLESRPAEGQEDQLTVWYGRSGEKTIDSFSIAYTIDGGSFSFEDHTEFLFSAELNFFDPSLDLSPQTVMDKLDEAVEEALGSEELKPQLDDDIPF